MRFGSVADAASPLIGTIYPPVLIGSEISLEEAQLVARSSVTESYFYSVLGSGSPAMSEVKLEKCSWSSKNRSRKSWNNSVGSYGGVARETQRELKPRSRLITAAMGTANSERSTVGTTFCLGTHERSPAEPLLNSMYRHL